MITRSSKRTESPSKPDLESGPKRSTRSKQNVCQSVAQEVMTSGTKKRRTVSRLAIQPKERSKSSPKSPKIKTTKQSKRKQTNGRNVISNATKIEKRKKTEVTEEKTQEVSKEKDGHHGKDSDVSAIEVPKVQRMDNKTSLSRVMKTTSSLIGEQSSRERTKRVKPNYALRKRKSNGMVCEKSSFDRFGDDLTELMLSFLPIREKFKFECLSKQIQRLIFNKQRYFSINFYDNFSIKLMIPNKYYTEYKLNYDLLKNILGKLKFLSYLKVGDVVVNAKLFKTVAENCLHLRHLKISRIGSKFKDNKTNIHWLTYFGQKCGQNLLSLKLCKNLSDECVRQLLSLTPNLTSIEVRNLRTVLKKTNEESDNRSIVLPKLQIITLNDYSDYSDSELAQFQEDYCNTIQVINTSSDRLLSGFSTFHRLQSFNLNFSLDSKPSIDYFYNSLTLIAVNCLQLRTLVIDGSDLTRDNIFDVFGKFKNLWTLRLRIAEIETEAKINYGSVRDLKQLTQLKHLTLDLHQLSDKNVENIDIYLPNLVLINFETGKHITDKTLNSMSKLKALQTLKIECNNDRVEQNITDSGVNQLLDKCSTLRRLLLYYNINDFDDENVDEKPFDITRVSVDGFVKKAKQNLNIDYEFKFDWGENWDQFERLRVSKNFPRNLSI